MTPVHPDLTDREEALMDLACDHPDFSREQLGDRLGISEHTVKVYLDRARAKYGVHTHKAAAIAHDRRRRRVRRSRSRRPLGQLEWMA